VAVAVVVGILAQCKAVLAVVLVPMAVTVPAVAQRPVEELNQQQVEAVQVLVDLPHLLKLVAPEAAEMVVQDIRDRVDQVVPVG
jgi:hypothetical protein